MTNKYNNDKEKNKNLSRNLDISRQLTGRQRERVKTLSLEITKQLKLPKTINLCKNFSPLKIAKELQMSGLSHYECRKIVKLIKNILQEFRLNPNSLLDLNKTSLKSLPAGIRRFLISLMVLKAELLNVRKIQKDFETRIRMEREEENLNRNSKINTVIRAPRLETGRYKKCSTAIGLSYGDYIGPMGVGQQYNRNNFNTKYREKKQNNTKSNENKKTFYNDFYKTNTKTKKCVIHYNNNKI